AFIFNTLAQEKAFQDRLRGYADPIDERNLGNEIEGPAVRALLAACEARYPLVQRYYRLKARLLGLPALQDYDRYAPLPEAAGGERIRKWGRHGVGGASRLGRA